MKEVRVVNDSYCLRCIGQQTQRGEAMMKTRRKKLMTATRCDATDAEKAEGRSCVATLPGNFNWRDRCWVEEKKKLG